MNFRTILHLFDTLWKRLCWHIVLGWVLMLVVAWPAFTFRPELMVGAGGEVVYNAGGNYYQAAWQVYPSLLLTLQTVVMAALIALQGRSWSGTRPLRSLDVLASRMVALMTFQVVPLVGLSMVNLLVHGFSVEVAMKAGLQSSLVVLPHVAAAALFARVCGSFWRWCAGMVVFMGLALVGSSFVPYLGSQMMFVSDPLGANIYPIFIWMLWIGMLALAVLTTCLRERWRATVRIAVVLVGWLGVSPLLYLTPWGRDFLLYRREGISSRTRADLSGGVQPAIAGPSLEARMTTLGTSGYQNLPEDSFRGLRVLEMKPRWKPTGLPDDCFSVWERKGSSALIIDGEIAATGIPRTRSNAVPGWRSPETMDEAVFLAALPPGTSFHPDDPFAANSPSRRTHEAQPPENSDTSNILKILNPALLKDGAEAYLEEEVTGSVFHYEIVMDVPVDHETDGETPGTKFEVNVRRYRQPDVGRTHHQGVMAEVTVLSTTWNHSSDFAPDISPTGWLPFFYLPSIRQLVSCPIRGGYPQPLLSGCVAVQLAYIPGVYEHRELPDLTGARFIMLRPRIFGTVRGKASSGPLGLKLSVDASVEKTISFSRNMPRRTEVPLPETAGAIRLSTLSRSQLFPDMLAHRPDPGTASAEDYWRWEKATYTNYAPSGWPLQDSMQFLPRQLPLFLKAEDYGVWESALVRACPESRKAEILTALPLAGRQIRSTWLAGLIQQRGWAKDAAAELHRLLGAGGRPDGHLIAAVASLEDPSTIPDLLSVLENEGDFQTYELVRQIPGIEPGLTAAVKRGYERNRKENEALRKESRGQFRPGSPYLPAISHGLREAFDDWFNELPATQKWYDEQTKGRFPLRWNAVNGVILVPLGLEESQDDAREIYTSHVASDYTWDPLTRRWALAETLNR